MSFGPLTIIRLNRPKVINSLNLEMIRQADFVEGVRARIIDRDDMPVWNPASIKAVKDIPSF